MWLVVGGWWLGVGGWWLVVGGWWVVGGGWWVVGGVFVYGVWAYLLTQSTNGCWPLGAFAGRLG